MILSVKGFFLLTEACPYLSFGPTRSDAKPGQVSQSQYKVLFDDIECSRGCIRCHPHSVSLLFISGSHAKRYGNRGFGLNRDIGLQNVWLLNDEDSSNAK